MPDKLPIEDHVVRYVRKPRLRKDEDGRLLGILPQALERREGEEYLSVTWLQHFAPEYERGLSAAAEALQRQLTIKGGDGFSVGQVKKIDDICEAFEINVRILHEPEPPQNTGHSAIRGLPRDNLDLLAMLADEAFTDTRIASSVLIKN